MNAAPRVSRPPQDVTTAVVLSARALAALLDVQRAAHESPRGVARIVVANASQEMLDAVDELLQARVIDFVQSLDRPSSELWFVIAPHLRRAP